MTHEAISTATENPMNTPDVIPPEIEMPPVVQAEETAPNPEQAVENLRLPSEQRKLLVDYTLHSTDKGQSAEHYQKVLARMDTLAERDGDDPTLGKLAVTAATMGALTRTPDRFKQHGRSLMDRARSMGLQDEHAKIFIRIQQDYAAKQSAGIPETLRSGLRYLDKRQQVHGEDISSARIAFLASGFAATQDTSLRQAIVKQL
ncbi:MAG: hypothetical protein ACREGB_02650 [Candidatus Saccharimonadales bacterium]